jgi:hypothetical protein
VVTLTKQEQDIEMADISGDFAGNWRRPMIVAEQAVLPCANGLLSVNQRINVRLRNPRECATLP